MPERPPDATGELQASTMVANMVDSLYDPFVRRAIKQLEEYNGIVEGLSLPEQTDLMQQLDQELWSAYMAGIVKVTGLVTRYNSDIAGCYVYEMDGREEESYVEGWLFEFNGCVVQQCSDGAEIVLGGVVTTIDDDGVLQTAMYGIPLNAILDFQDVHSMGRLHATLCTELPNLMEEIDCVTLTTDHIDETDAIRALAALSLEDLEQYRGSNESFTTTVKMLNAYLAHLLPFDKHMAYMVSFEGPTEDGTEITVEGMLMAGESVKIVEIGEHEDPLRRSVGVVMEMCVLDPWGKDGPTICLPIQNVTAFVSTRTAYFGADNE